MLIFFASALLLFGERTDSTNHSAITEQSFDVDANALDAINALRSYLNDDIYDEKEMALLWEEAIQNSGIPEITLARDAYEEAVTYRYDKQKYREFCDITKALLTSAWYKLPFPQPEALLQKGIYPNFDDHPDFDEVMRQKMRPHLLPLDHPAKAALDKIFTTHLALIDEVAFANAGFETISSKTMSGVRVAKHPAIPGYLVKVYLYTRASKNTPGATSWENLTLRCEGAGLIRQLIKKQKMKYFVVPKKWIYPLPMNSHQVIPESQKHPVILIVEDMKLVNKEQSGKIWKTISSHKILNELYCILSHGYSSTFLPENIPYTKKDTFACIDTEHPKRTHDLNKVNAYISQQMRKYWKNLVENNGP